MKPYTYLVGWSLLNTYYYGVRYAKNADPSDLWSTYFTSSKHVSQYRKQHGEPDIIEIRRTFDTKEAARKWEHKVLRRMKITTDRRWLNITDNISIKHPPDHQKGEKNSMYGRKRSDTSLMNMKRIGSEHPLYGKKRPEHSKMMSERNPMSGENAIPFWTDGITNVRHKECPGPEWRRGFIRRKGRAKSHIEKLDLTASS